MNITATKGGVRIPAYMVALALALGGCKAWLPSAGPTVNEMNASASGQGLSESDVTLVEVDAGVLRQLNAGALPEGFPAGWQGGKPSLTLGRGDVVQISVFEAPPAVLLASSRSAGAADLSLGGGSGILNLPDQMVGSSGTVTVPFAGQIQVSGKTTAAVEQIIRSRLSKIANKPQVVVRLTQNQTNGVTVVADGRSVRLPLTPKGERLLDVVPLAGDGKAVKHTSVNLTRNGITRSVSLKELARNARNNVYLRNGDVVTVAQNPYRVTILGATNSNAALDFGDDGMTVAEAIGRVAGLNDYRADPGGVYVLRQNGGVSSDGLNKPTVYRLDLRKAGSMVLTQQFRLQDKDMVYVSNAPSIRLQKILGLFNASLAPVSSTAGTINSLNGN